ncbi:hypothetical protein [Actinomadura sp. 3N407]|uniref:hypothetical protein n=1 Tax=Actinomadura sp. 3N407 TaxID=3457423 RepID=UPI003FCCECCD
MVKLVGKLEAPKALAHKLGQKLGRRGIIGVSVAAALVVVLAGYLLVSGSGDDGGAPGSSVARGGDGGAVAAEPGNVGDTGRGDSQDPKNLGQAFGLEPVMGRWRHNEAGTGAWILTVDKAGALHSKESSVPEQLGQIEPAAGRTFELMIQDPRAGGTAAYTARLSPDGKTLEVGIGTTKVRKFAKIG